MKIPKAKAIELIDKKIKQFEQVQKDATYENRYKEEYQLAYQGTEMLLTELFSEDETKSFRIEVTGPAIAFIGREIDYEGEVRDYRDHISKCIAQLKAYRERIENFWSDEEEKNHKNIYGAFCCNEF